MDHIVQRFQVDPTNEQLESSSNPCQQQETRRDQSIPTQDGSDLISKLNFGRRHKSAIPIDGIDPEDASASRKKQKIIQRDIERQRRREMANLYASLRSLLPFEYIKVHFFSSVLNTGIIFSDLICCTTPI